MNKYLWGACACFLGLSIYYKIQYEHLQLELAQNQTRHAEEMRAIERNQFQEVINAIDKYNERKIQIDVDSTDADAANKRLHDTINKLNLQVSKLASSAKIEYANALSNVLKECTTEYRQVAKQADGHAADAVMLKELFEKATLAHPNKKH